MSSHLRNQDRRRKAKLAGSVLSITFPRKEKSFVKSLGGFLRLGKSQDKNLTGQLVFSRPEDADTAMAFQLPAGITLKRKAPQQTEINVLSLKVTGIPDAAGVDDIAALFPESSDVIVKEKRRNDFFIGTDKQFRNLLGKEAVVRFDSKEECARSFTKSEKAQILGHEVTVTYGQKNRKINKSKRKKQRTIRRK